MSRTVLLGSSPFFTMSCSSSTRASLSEVWTALTSPPSAVCSGCASSCAATEAARKRAAKVRVRRVGIGLFLSFKNRGGGSWGGIIHLARANSAEFGVFRISPRARALWSLWARRTPAAATPNPPRRFPRRTAATAAENATIAPRSFSQTHHQEETTMQIAKLLFIIITGRGAARRLRAEPGGISGAGGAEGAGGAGGAGAGKEAGGAGAGEKGSIIQCGRERQYGGSDTSTCQRRGGQCERRGRLDAFACGGEGETRRRLRNC